jgi:methionine sulfoxide reductase heme-binding subunit
MRTSDAADEGRKTTDDGRRTTLVHRLSPVVRRLVPSLTPLQLVLHVLSLLPLAVLIWDGLHDHLTVNPIQEITNRTGLTALALLVVSLACTPANTLFGFKQALKLRRPLGLYAFMYAGLHFLTFSVLDYGLDWGLIQETIVEKRYVLVGFAALLLLTPLAITSTKGWMRRLGKRWKRLHGLVYLAVPLAVLHFVWLVKADIRVPLQYGAVVVLLLVLRIPRVRAYMSGLRYRLFQPRRTSSPEVIRPVRARDTTPVKPHSSHLEKLTAAVSEESDSGLASQGLKESDS